MKEQEKQEEWKEKERRKWYANRKQLITEMRTKSFVDVSYFFLIILRNINGINKKAITDSDIHRRGDRGNNYKPFL